MDFEKVYESFNDESVMDEFFGTIMEKEDAASVAQRKFLIDEVIFGAVKKVNPKLAFEADGELMDHCKKYQELGFAIGFVYGKLFDLPKEKEARRMLKDLKKRIQAEVLAPPEDSQRTASGEFIQ